MSPHPQVCARGRLNMKGNESSTHREPTRCRLFRLPYFLHQQKLVDIKVTARSHIPHLNIGTRPSLSATSPSSVVEIPSANWPTSISTAASLRLAPTTCTRIQNPGNNGYCEYLLEE